MRGSPTRSRGVERWPWAPPRRSPSCLASRAPVRRWVAACSWDCRTRTLRALRSCSPRRSSERPLRSSCPTCSAPAATACAGRPPSGTPPRLRLGVLVRRATFRLRWVLAKNVPAVDHISGGRVELGLGAGWNEREHEAYGFEFPPLGTRLEVLEEQLAIVRGAWAEGPFSFAGKHYRIVALDALPKPVQRPRPPVIIGGAAKPRTARLAAQFADEY